MSPTSLPPPLRLAAELGARWVRRQRRLLRPSGRRLEAAERAWLVRHFEAGSLDSVRLLRTSHLGLPGRRGWTVRLALSATRMRAITLADTMVVGLPAGRAVPPALLFHEMVHVAQFEVLGVEAFVREYLRGWAAHGYRYRMIPLERTAYTLGAAFQVGALEESVNELVAREFAEAERPVV